MRLHWQHSLNEMQQWNEALARVVEVFGLPGARYITDVTINNMTFWFHDHRDALLFKLCHGHAELHPA
jgi:hypothetical protein